MPSLSARQRMAESVRGLFSHLDRVPLAETARYPGDPGLFGPDSVTWRVQRHPAVFIGGPRALIVQACHPEVLAGVVDHSSYRSDPLGRLSRTSAYVTAATFGAMPEVEEAVEIVKGAHRWVRGFSPRGIPYAADEPGHAAWVHNALVDSFLTAYQTYGPGLSAADADRYVAEQTRLGAMLDADPLPETAAELSAFVADHPAVERSPDLPEVLRFLRRPPLSPGVLAGYRVVFDAAVHTLPDSLLEVTGLRRRPGARTPGTALVKVLSWALGTSPAYTAAMERVAASEGSRAAS